MRKVQPVLLVPQVPKVLRVQLQVQLEIPVPLVYQVLQALSQDLPATQGQLVVRVQQALSQDPLATQALQEPGEPIVLLPVPPDPQVRSLVLQGLRDQQVQRALPGRRVP